MKITSSAFKDDKVIPKKYSCEEDNINPPLEFSELPDNTKSLAIIVHDHDAIGGDFVHWIIWNISPEIMEIEEGTAPIGAIEGANDMEKTGWYGPCPPSGTHRYEFHLYALDTMLTLTSAHNKEDLRNEMKGHIMGEAVLTGTYKNKK